MVFKQRWQQLSQTFSQLSQREQYLIALTGVVAVVMTFSMLLIEPKLTTASKLDGNVSQLNKSNQQLVSTIDSMNQRLAQDPNQILKQQLKTQHQKLSIIDAELTELTKEIISPQQMRSALTKLLAFESGVELLKFEALPVIVVNDQQQVNESDSETNTSPDNEVQGSAAEVASTLILYRHGIKLTLTGSYTHLYEYLNLVEQLPWRFFWSEFNFQRKQYPTAELELELYSISTEKEFIGV